MAQINRKNWLISLKKWENIVAELEHKPVPHKGFFSECGFCIEFHDDKHYTNRDCSECPLYQMEICANYPTLKMSKRPFWIYDDWSNGDINRLNAAKKVLDAIKSLEPK